MAEASLAFTIDADHGQFFIQDLDSYDAWQTEHGDDPGLSPGGWTDEAVMTHRIGLEPHSITVGTARDDLVEARITVHTAAPDPIPTAVHIVEADLDAPTGHLAVSSPGVDPADGPSLEVPPGLLRARVSYLPSEPSTVDTNGGPGDFFLYQIDLWPTAQADALHVRKQGPSPWAE